MSVYYFIKSNLNDYVLEVTKGNTVAGTPISPYPKTGAVEQQWRDDPATGTIRNRLDDFCMDTTSGQLLATPYKSGNRDQQWERKWNAIESRGDKNIVIDICELDKNPGAKVIKHPRNGGSNQSWTFIPVDN